MAGSMAACRQTWRWRRSWEFYIWICRQRTGLSFWDLKAHLLGTDTLPLTKPYLPPTRPYLLIVPRSRNQVFKQMSIWGPLQSNHHTYPYIVKVHLLQEHFSQLFIWFSLKNIYATISPLRLIKSLSLSHAQRTFMNKTKRKINNNRASCQGGMSM